MLVAIRNDTKNPEPADQASRHYLGYRCPACNGKVILRRGAIKIAHFAHERDSNCSHGKESNLHRACKFALYQSLQKDPMANHVRLEHDLGYARADVYYECRGQGYALEVQKTSISIDEVLRRSARYAEHGVAVTWVIPEPEDLTGEVNPNSMQRCLHAMGFGRYYRWNAGGALVPVHLQGVSREVKAKDGTLYRKRYKSRAKAVLGAPVTPTEMRPSRNEARQLGSYAFPALLIGMDRQRPWW